MPIRYVYLENPKSFLLNSIQDISIATDGILMFKKVLKNNSTDDINPIEYLIIDKSEIEQENMLEFKLKELENLFGYKPTDDLALIRLIND